MEGPEGTSGGGGGGGDGGGGFLSEGVLPFAKVVEDKTGTVSFVDAGTGTMSLVDDGVGTAPREG